MDQAGIVSTRRAMQDIVKAAMVGASDGVYISISCRYPLIGIYLSSVGILPKEFGVEEIYL